MALPMVAVLVPWEVYQHQREGCRDISRVIRSAPATCSRLGWSLQSGKGGLVLVRLESGLRWHGLGGSPAPDRVVDDIQPPKDPMQNCPPDTMVHTPGNCDSKGVSKRNADCDCGIVTHDAKPFAEQTTLSSIVSMPSPFHYRPRRQQDTIAPSVSSSSSAARWSAQ